MNIVKSTHEIIAIFSTISIKNAPADKGLQCSCINRSADSYAVEIHNVREVGQLYESGLSIRQSTMATAVNTFAVLDYDIHTLDELCVLKGKDLAWALSRSTATKLKFLRAAGIGHNELSAALHAKENVEILDNIPATEYISVHKSPSAVQGVHPYRRKVFMALERPIAIDLSETDMGLRREQLEELRAARRKAILDSHRILRKQFGLRGWMLPDLAMASPTQLTLGSPVDLGSLRQFHPRPKATGLMEVDARRILQVLGMRGSKVDPTVINPTEASLRGKVRESIVRERRPYRTITAASLSASGMFKFAGISKRNAAFLPHKDMHMSFVREGRRHKCAVGFIKNLTINAFGQAAYLPTLGIECRITAERLAHQVFDGIQAFWENASEFLREEKDRLTAFVHRLHAEFTTNPMAAFRKYGASMSYRPRFTRAQLLAKCAKALALARKRCFGENDAGYAFLAPVT